MNIVNVSRDSDPSSDTSTGQDEEPVWTWSFLDRVWVLKNRWDILKRLGSFCFMNILKAKVQRRVSWWPTRPLNLPKKTGQEIKAPTGIVAVKATGFTATAVVKRLEEEDSEGMVVVKNYLLQVSTPELWWIFTRSDNDGISLVIWVQLQCVCPSDRVALCLLSIYVSDSPCIVML